MSVFTSLSKEHALLLRIIGRLERCAADPNPRLAARDTRHALLVLLNALELHESLEDLVFDAVPTGASPAGEQARELITSQHAVLTRLGADARELLAQRPGQDDLPLQVAATRLARLLRLHFLDEERTLWPSFNACAGRSALKHLARQAREHLRTMTRDLDLYWAAIDDYMTSER